MFKAHKSKTYNVTFFGIMLLDQKSNTSFAYNSAFGIYILYNGCLSRVKNDIIILCQIGASCGTILIFRFPCVASFEYDCCDITFFFS